MVSLVLSQFVTTPLSMLVNAVLARTLGAGDFGTIYLATTMVSLGFLFVEWGQGATIAAEVSKDRSRAEYAVGTGIVLKLAGSVVVTFCLALVTWLLGYDRAVWVALGLIVVQTFFVAMGNGYQAVLRGHERFDLVSRVTVAGNILAAAFVIPVALLGGKLRGTLAAQAAAAALALVTTVWLARSVGLRRPRVSRATAAVLFHTGTGFFILNLVLALQPNVDAVVLSKLASTEAVGWFAAARRLTGLLIFPATTLSFALYPTLVRLWRDDRAEYTRLVTSALRTVLLLGICISTGTFLFADVAIRVVYGTKGYAPAVSDLRVLSGFVMLLFFSLIPGSAILASGRQMLWSAVQGICIVVSAVGDPLLVPVFQGRFGNGGLGVCVSAIVSESLMIAFAMVLLRDLHLPRALAPTLWRALLGGAGMILLERALRGVSPLLTIPACVAVYFGIVYALGGIEREQVMLLRETLRGKVANANRARPTS